MQTKQIETHDTPSIQNLAQEPYTGKYLYHITTLTEWEAQQERATFTPSRYAHDGFIHCSDSIQTALEIANKFHKDSTESFFLFKVTTKELTAPVYIDNGKTKYPHVYGLLNITAITKVSELERSPNNEFIVGGGF